MRCGHDLTSASPLKQGDIPVNRKAVFKTPGKCDRQRSNKLEPIVRTRRFDAQPITRARYMAKKSPQIHAISFDRAFKLTIKLLSQAFPLRMSQNRGVERDYMVS
jgi:hypothetical protein